MYDAVFDSYSWQGDLVHFDHSARDKSHLLERRTLLRWLGTAALALPAALSACANSIPPRHYQRPPSHITGKDHRNGEPQPNRVISVF